MKGEVGGMIPGCEISSLLVINLLASGQLPPMLWRWHVDLLSQKEVNKIVRLVSDDLELPDDGGEITKSQGKGSRFDFRL